MSLKMKKPTVADFSCGAILIAVELFILLALFPTTREYLKKFEQYLVVEQYEAEPSDDVPTIPVPVSPAPKGTVFVASDDMIAFMTTCNSGVQHQSVEVAFERCMGVINGVRTGYLIAQSDKEQTQSDVWCVPDDETDADVFKVLYWWHLNNPDIIKNLAEQFPPPVSNCFCCYFVVYVSFYFSVLFYNITSYFLVVFRTCVLYLRSSI